MAIAAVLVKAAAMSLALVAPLVDGESTSASAGAGRGGDECLAVPTRLPLHVRLNNGVTVPRIGFGTAGLGHAAEEAVKLALAAGYRHIDTAQAQEWYREEDVGRAIRHVAAAAAGAGDGSSGGAGGWAETLEAGAVEAGSSKSGAGLPHRADLIVTTKIHPRDFGPDRIGAMVETSDRNLQGVDLLLLHAPFCWPGSCPENPTPWQEGWRELEKLYSKGAARAIGVSNFSEGLLRELLEMAKVVPAVVQNWMDPFHQDRAVRALCTEHGIAYIAYSTLGGQWVHRPSSSPSSQNPLSADPTLEAVASAHGTSVQAVALSWAMQSGALILPRSSNAARIRDNLRVFVKDVGGTGTGGSFSASNNGDAGAGRVDRGCQAGASGGGASAVEVFLTDAEMTAIDRLDGTIGS